MSTVPHPATYPDAALGKFTAIVGYETRRLGRPLEIADPMAGVGTIRRVFPNAWCCELEPEWAGQIPGFPHRVLIGDAAEWRPVPLDVIVTSPPWGNRLADSYAGSKKDHESKGGARTKRRTYRIALGHDLSDGSLAAVHHRRSGEQSDFTDGLVRILRPWVAALRDPDPTITKKADRATSGGLVLVDIADHQRDGRWITAAADTANALTTHLGLTLIDVDPVDARRYTSGAGDTTIRFPELILTFRKTKETP